MNFIHEAGWNATETPLVLKAGSDDACVRRAVCDSKIRLHGIGSKEQGACAPMLMQGVGS